MHGQKTYSVVRKEEEMPWAQRMSKVVWPRL